MKNKGMTTIVLVVVTALLLGSITYTNNAVRKHEQRYENLLLETYSLGAFRPSNYVGKLLTRLGEGGSETTFNTTPGTAADDSTLTNAKLGDFIVFTINPGADNEEKISASAVSVSGTTATWTIINRGLSFTENAVVTANKKQHAIGETVIISNDDHYLSQQFVNVDDTQTITGVKTFSNGVVFSTAASSTNECDETVEYCTKDYIDNSINQGAATSTESVAGIGELATTQESASSTQFDANNPHFQNSEHATDTPQNCSGTSCDIWADLTGKLKQGWLNLAELFTFSGGLLSTSSTTITATTTISASDVNNSALVLRGIAYSAPPQITASNTVWTVDAAGNTYWEYTDWQLLGETTLSGANATVTVSGLPARKYLKIVVDSVGKSGSNETNLRFNGDGGASNYGTRHYENNGTETITAQGTDEHVLLSADNSTQEFFVINVVNNASRIKVVTFEGTSDISGASAPTPVWGSAVWNNTSNAITQVDLTNQNSFATFNAGTNVRVYGSRN